MQNKRKNACAKEERILWEETILHNSSSKMQVLWVASPGVDRTLGGVKCPLI